MRLETIILVLAWIITIAVLLFTVPKNKLREAILIFFFKQLITWVAGLAVAQLRLIEYPVRSFPYATRASFDFEYFIYPAVTVVFNLKYPEEKNWFRQFLHYFNICTILTVIHQYHYIRSLGMVYDMAFDLHYPLYVQEILLLVFQHTQDCQLNSVYRKGAARSTI